MAIRVLHIVTYMGRGGLETMLMNYYRHIDRNKVQFDFLVHRDFEADYDTEIRELGGKIYHISRLIPWSHFYREKMKRFFREHSEYKIVHVHQDCLSSVALQCAKECGVPVRIAHSHNNAQDKNLKYLVKLYYMKKIPNYATDLFACSNAAGTWMFGGESFQVVHNAIDISKYKYSPTIAKKVRKQFNIENKIVIGHVGRFDPQKNHERLVDIFAECAKKNSDVILMLVGDGDRKKKIEDKVNKLGLGEKVIFTGVRSDVNELMQAMDVFVFPSLYEGLPVTLIEAQAAGLPCVISDYISEECIVTSNLVSIMKLSESATGWGEGILKKVEDGHRNIAEEIEKSGYDIKIAAKKLEKYYLNKENKDGQKSNYNYTCL